MITILFVCSGNTCRSPMTQALLQRRMLCEGAGTGEEYRVLSAGLLAGDGHPASQDAIMVMGHIGLDLTGHSSVRLTHGLIRDADLILTMTINQRSHILQKYPEKADCTFTINEITGDLSGEVLDPYGLGLDAYRACLAQLKTLVDELFDIILDSKTR